MMSPIDLDARRVSESHVVFEYDGVRWILHLDLPPGMPVNAWPTLRLRGCEKVPGPDGTTRLSIRVLHVLRDAEKDYSVDLDVWVRVPATGCVVAELLDARRALLASLPGPDGTVPAEPCTGIARDVRWPPAEHSTRFDLPGGRAVTAALRSFTETQGEREWLPMWVRATTDYEDEGDHGEGHVAAHYDFGRKRVFASLTDFLVAHGLGARDGACWETNPVALGALAEIAGLAWRPSHVIVYSDREGLNDSEGWIVGAQGAGDEKVAAPTLGEVLGDADATWTLDPVRGWARDGEFLRDRRGQIDSDHYEIEALWDDSLTD